MEQFRGIIAAVKKKLNNQRMKFLGLSRRIPKHVNFPRKIPVGFIGRYPRIRTEEIGRILANISEGNS